MPTDVEPSFEELSSIKESVEQWGKRRALKPNPNKQKCELIRLNELASSAWIFFDAPAFKNLG